MYNPFIENALNYALSYIEQVSHTNSAQPLSITLLADNGFYANSSLAQNDFTKSKTRLRSYHTSLGNISKTGLGSSAALTTALISSLLISQLEHMQDIDVHREKIHRLAQAAHFAAQGGVGSGFDVAAAVHGSCIYRRFSPSTLQIIGSPVSDFFSDRLYTTVEGLDPGWAWDGQCGNTGMSLPPGVRFVLCDINSGSHTPSMLRKAVQWWGANEESALLLRNSLDAANRKLYLELRRLQPFDPSPVDLQNPYSGVRAAIEGVRHHLRALGKAADLPIEPKIQTALLDAVSTVPGVIGGVVPGAGGYDAVVLLVQDSTQIVARIEEFLEMWGGGEKAGCNAGPTNIRPLPTTAESQGLRIEPIGQYSEWLDARTKLTISLSRITHWALDIITFCWRG